MAKIVLGLATSHGPQVIVPPELWELRVPADKTNPHQYFRGKSYTWDELAKLRAGENIPARITMDEKRARSARCAVAADSLRKVYRDANIDAAVILGNDQFELLTGDNATPFSVYWGDSVEAIPKTPEQLLKVPEGARPAEIGYCPPERTEYRCHPELGLALIDSLMRQDFDVGHSKVLPVGRMGNNGVPHAYGYVYRRVMEDKVVPHVPVFVNTHYPPNRPTAARCVDFGRALGKAIAAWPSDARIAVIASGGLSHYVIDETFDGMVLASMRKGDAASIDAIDENIFEAGTAEIKNWLPLFGAMLETKMPMTLVDYVPCYRSEAGTGNAMGFAYWRQG
jgi:hypothetical protein